jgi:hypothetical protein
MIANDRRNADAVLIASLASGHTFESAAHAAGVSPRTVRRRMDDESFTRELENAGAKIVQIAIGRAVAAAGAAVDVIATLMREAESEAVRLRAACSLLDLLAEVGSDPVKAAFQGRTYSGDEVAALAVRLGEAALLPIPDERADALLSDLQDACSSR